MKMTTDDISLAIHSEVLRRCNTEWAKISTDLSNDLIERCDDVEDFIQDLVSEFEDRIQEEISKK